MEDPRGMRNVDLRNLGCNSVESKNAKTANVPFRVMEDPRGMRNVEYGLGESRPPVT